MSQASKKKFWSFIKAKKAEGMGVSPLKDAGKLITDPREQAQILNNQFHSVFIPRHTITTEEFELHCLPQSGLPDIPTCGVISIIEEGERKLLQSLIPNKACGPDSITPKPL